MKGKDLTMPEAGALADETFERIEADGRAARAEEACEESDTATCRTCGTELTGEAQCWSCQRDGLSLAEAQLAEKDKQIAELEAANEQLKQCLLSVGNAAVLSKEALDRR